MPGETYGPQRRCALTSFLDPIHQVYFILAGKTRTDAANPYRRYFIWTKKKLPQLDSDEIGTVLAAMVTISGKN